MNSSKPKDTFFIAACLALCFVCSCQTHSENANDSSKETIAGKSRLDTLEISPIVATRGSTVHLISPTLSFSDAKIEWLFNGAAVENSWSNQFILSAAKKGDTLQAKAQVQGRQIVSNTVSVGNTPPEITSANLVANPDNPTDAFSAKASANDADGDAVTLQYEWTVNGAPAGTGEVLGIRPKRGDMVAVKVTPYDGESYGRSVEVNTLISNLPPVIHEHTDFQFDGSLYKYQVKASDPDGDDLIYTIESGTEGMAVDTSGLITWNVPPEFKGLKSVPVVVTDGHGGNARYLLRITIK